MCEPISQETLLTSIRWRKRGYHLSIVRNGCSSRYTLLVASANKHRSIVLRKMSCDSALPPHIHTQTQNLRDSSQTLPVTMMINLRLLEFSGAIPDAHMLMTFEAEFPSSHAVAHSHSWLSQVTTRVTWSPLRGALVHNGE